MHEAGIIAILVPTYIFFFFNQLSFFRESKPDKIVGILTNLSGEGIPVPNYGKIGDSGVIFGSVPARKKGEDVT